MRLGSHRKVPLEFLSEPPFRSYFQNSSSKSKRRLNTGILPCSARIPKKLRTKPFTPTPSSERTAPNKNTRFRGEDAPHERAEFGRGVLFFFAPGHAPERCGPTHAPERCGPTRFRSPVTGSRFISILAIPYGYWFTGRQERTTADGIVSAISYNRWKYQHIIFAVLYATAVAFGL
jgi:hypothetical protein